MATNTSGANESNATDGTDPTDYPLLGHDAQGATHRLDLTGRRVYVLVDGDVVQERALPNDSVQEWVDAVADQAGWDELFLDERPTDAWLADALTEVANG